MASFLPSSLLAAVTSLMVASCSIRPDQDVYRMPIAQVSSWFEKDELTLNTAGGKIPVSVTTGDGSRPVLLLHELNGQTRGSLALAHELAQRGCKVYVPRFFGVFGNDKKQGVLSLILPGNRWHMFQCETGPIRQDVREIAAQVMALHPGQPLTVIGNCMTGAMPVELLAEPGIDTAVVCQPALPVGRSSGDGRLGIPQEVIDRTVAAMKKNPHKRLVSFNYLADSFAPVAGQATLARSTAAAGVGARHLLYIGVHAEDPRSGADYDQLATHPGFRPVPVEYREPAIRRHSTVSEASEPDVTRYRERLYSALGLPAKVPPSAGRNIR
jgi:dienelactone hydrolase